MKTLVQITETQKKIILHWGEMGSWWGVNRTTAQIHVLLFLSENPLTADDIMETLSVSRSNVSMCLQELKKWGIIKTVTDLGSRKEKFQSIRDVWEIFRKILDERKKREIDPTLTLLNETQEELSKDNDASPELKARVKDMHEFFGTLEDLYQNFKALPIERVKKMSKMSRQILKFVG